METPIEFFRVKMLAIGFLFVIIISGLTSIFASEQTVIFAYVTIALAGIIGGVKILDKIGLQ